MSRFQRTLFRALLASACVLIPGNMKGQAPKKKEVPADSIRVLLHFDSLDATAARVFRDASRNAEHRVEHGRSGGPFHYVHTLYLLPSGRLGFPFTGTVTERDKVTFEILKPDALPVSVKIISCGRSVFDRVLQPARGEGTTGARQTFGRLAEIPDTAFHLRKLSTVSRCSDSLTFEVSSIHAVEGIALISTTTTTILSDPTYLYALGGGFRYDMARPERWKIDQRPNAVGVATENYLRSARDRVGPGAFVSMGFRPCGLNPRTVRGVFPSASSDWRSAICPFLSPTFILPIPRTLDAFSIALPIFSAFGSEFVVGASFAQIERLKSDINAGVSDTSKFVGEGRRYSLPGDPPITRSWTRKGTGWYFGFATSTAAIKAFFDPAAGAEKKSSSTQQAETREAPENK